MQRGENSALYWKQVSGENEIINGDADMFGDFRCVTMSEHAISAEIFIHFDEMGFTLWFFARAANARFTIAHDTARYVDPPGFCERPKSQDNGSRVAARISDESRFRQRVRVELRQAVDCCGKRFRISG